MVLLYYDRLGKVPDLHQKVKSCCHVLCHHLQYAHTEEHPAQPEDPLFSVFSHVVMHLFVPRLFEEHDDCLSKSKVATIVIYSHFPHILHMLFESTLLALGSSLNALSLVALVILSCCFLVAFSLSLKSILRIIQFNRDFDHCSLIYINILIYTKSANGNLLLKRLRHQY